MSPALIAFTLFHVAISLAGIISGFVVIAGMFQAKRLDGWTKIFLTTTIATSVTGFMFPVHRFMASHALGIMSLMVLGIALFARYKRGMAGGWRWGFVVTALTAQYFNVFVLVVQGFEKVPALKSLAPTQTEGPFKVTQLAVLVIFIVLTVVAGVRFQLGPPRIAGAAAI